MLGSLWGGGIRYSRAEAATPKQLHCGEPQQINFTMTTNRDVMGASAISILKSHDLRKEMTPSMVKYKAVLYIYTPDLRTLAQEIDKPRGGQTCLVSTRLTWLKQRVSQSASFPQSPKLKEVTATLQDVVIDKREEARSVEVAKYLTIVFRGFRTLHFF
jgi:hypothetical protein